MSTTNSRERLMTPEQFSAHDVKLKQLEGDVHELKTTMNTFAAEVRTSINQIMNVISARDKTPWGTLLSAGSLLLTIVTVAGSLAIIPMKEAIQQLQMSVVPRAEHAREWTELERRFSNDENWVRRIDQRLWDNQTELLKVLREENNALRRELNKK